MEILTSHGSPEDIATETFPNYIWINQSQKGDASQLENMCHIPLTAQQPPRKDSITV